MRVHVRQNPVQCNVGSTDMTKVYNIIHSVYCDFCHLCIPTYAHEFYKVTNYPYERTPVCFSDKLPSSRRHHYGGIYNINTAN